jgi:hypothetical protein
MNDATAQAPLVAADRARTKTGSRYLNRPIEKDKNLQKIG